MWLFLSGCVQGGAQLQDRGVVLWLFTSFQRLRVHGHYSVGRNAANRIVRTQVRDVISAKIKIPFKIVRLPILIFSVLSSVDAKRCVV